MAQAGDTAAAEKLAAGLDKDFPLETLAQRYWLRAIRAVIALHRKDPGRAVELLQLTNAIDLGESRLSRSICVERPISYFTMAAMRKPNSRSLSIIAAWWRTQNGAHWPASALGAPTCCRATSPGPKRPIRTSSHCGRPRTRIFLSCKRRKRSTRNCGSENIPPLDVGLYRL
jgi:hypothetical protein